MNLKEAKEIVKQMLGENMISIAMRHDNKLQ
jgi:hypothetical protein